MLRKVPLAEKGHLRELFDTYRLDLHALTNPGEDLEPYPWFDAYWVEPDRHPYWICAGPEIVGFVMVNAWPESGLPIDQRIAEFCIRPDHRRHGLGQKTLAALMRLHPGQWELKVHRANLAGFAFWPRALEISGARDLTRIDWPDSLILRFCSP